MHRFYVPKKIDSDTVSITDPQQLHHLRDVLCLKTGDEVIVFDSRGNEYTGVVRELREKEAVLSVTPIEGAKTAAVRIAIACAMPKKAQMDEIIDSLTQLGVDVIIPMDTERVIVKLDEDKKEARLERWLRIAQSAAEQSQRNSVPVIEPVTTIKQVVSHSRGYDLKLIPTLSGERKHIKEVVAESRPESVIVLIGPEGDFTPQEVELATKAGFVPVSLGDSVLRVGTAAVAVASYLRFSLGL